MRLKQKFKIFKQIKNWKKLDYFPSQLLKTNKKSWQLLLASYNKVKAKLLLQESINTLSTIIKTKRWDLNRKAYKKGLDLKRLYYHFYNFSVKNKYLKKNYFLNAKKYKQNLFVNTSLLLLKPKFRLDILLWSLGFFNSIYESRNFIYNKYIILNSINYTQVNKIVNIGDIITVNLKPTKHLNFKENNSKKIMISKNFNFFCEIDYYTKNIIIINSFSNIIKTYDNPQIFYKKLNILKLISYLKCEY